MSALESVAGTDDLSGPRPLEPSVAEVGALVDGTLSPRSAVDPAHVATLVELDGNWPPILVHKPSMAIIDGSHRFAAAKQLGMRRVWVLLFDGTYDQATVQAIRSNIAHGLPLTLSDRKRASEGLLIRHPDWSDRRIAEICGVAAKTVARLRPSAVAQPGVGRSDRPAYRVGRDGRRRPASVGTLEHRVNAALLQDPRASLRTIAERTGTSHETVRRLRNGGRTRPGAGVIDAGGSWRPDSALAATGAGAAFATWFESHNVENCHWAAHIDHIPLSRIYEIIDEIERRRAVWGALAQELSRRTRATGRH